MALNANGTELVYNSSSYNLTQIQHVVQRTLSENGYEMRVFCIYPLSGQYGPLPRVLYYVLLLAGLLWRGHPWIAVVYLGVAMSYSAATAVHAFALIARYRWRTYPDDVPTAQMSASEVGDVDIMPVWAILSTAGIMLTPLLNWSSTVHHSRRKAVLLAWGALIFIALVAIFPAGIRARSIYMVQTTTTCYPNSSFKFPDGSDYCDPDDSWLQDVAFTSYRNYWRRCRCRDTCGEVSNTNAPYREDTTMMPFQITSRAKWIVNPEYVGVAYFNIFALIFVIVQGTLGLVQARWTQGTVRNLIFKRLYGQHPSPAPDSVRHRLRFHSAKWTALLIYTFAVFMSICCPPLFIINLVVSELGLVNWPRAEPFRAVGQWAPAVSAVFVLVAALIQQYEELAIKWIRRGCRHFYMRLSRSRARREAAPPLPGVGQVVRFTAGQLFLPFHGIYLQLVDGRRRLVQEWREIRDWYKDPVGQSVRRVDPEKGGGDPLSASHNHQAGSSQDVLKTNSSPKTDDNYS